MGRPQYIMIFINFPEGEMGVKMASFLFYLLGDMTLSCSESNFLLKVESRLKLKERLLVRPSWVF